MKLHPESARMFEVDEEVEKAKKVAFGLLGGRAYTRQEILGKLRGRQFRRRAIEQTVQTLERLGLIDDWAFARRFVQERMRLRPMGRQMLARELKVRGVAEETVQQVLDEALEGVDLGVVALDLLRSRQERYRGLERQKALSRMYGFLGRRGFEARIAREAAERTWAELEEAQEEETPWAG